MLNKPIAQPSVATLPASRERIFICTFAIGSGLTVLAGTAAMIATNIGPGLWLRNPAAWILALAACAGCTRLLAAPRVTVFVLLAVLALTFAGSGQQGVHRWIGFGPVQVNAAALVLPLSLMLIARNAQPSNRIAFAIVAVLTAGLLAWQPDMSQLAALTTGLLAWAAVRRDLRSLAWIVPLALAALFVCAHQPDPLDAVPYVEGIVQLAWAVSPLLAIISCALLLLTALSPLLLASDIDRRPAAVALAAYFVVSSIAWLFGAFPVPLVGYGLSFVLGWGFGAATLVVKRPSTRSNP